MRVPYTHVHEQKRSSSIFLHTISHLFRRTHEHIHTHTHKGSFTARAPPHRAGSAVVGFRDTQHKPNKIFSIRQSTPPRPAIAGKGPRENIGQVDASRGGRVVVAAVAAGGRESGERERVRAREQLSVKIRESEQRSERLAERVKDVTRNHAVSSVKQHSTTHLRPLARDGFQLSTPKGIPRL